MTALATARRRVVAALEACRWSWPLLARLVIGALFVSTGWTAVTSLDEVTAYFAKLGIPLPAASAVVVSWAELVCGVLLVAGLATRLAAVPLIVIMIVAIATAKLDQIHGLTELLFQVELAYLVMLVGIVLGGPGPVSLDRPLDRWLARPAAGDRP